MVSTNVPHSQTASVAPTSRHTTPASSEMTLFESIPDHVQKSLEKTKVRYYRMGGLVVSNPIMGCMGIGDSKWWDWVLDEAEAFPVLKAAYDRGVNTWDTANVYSNGRSEEIIGRAIEHYQIPRRKLVLMTKVGRIMADEGHEHDIVAFMNPLTVSSKDYVNQGGLSRKAIFYAVDQSLKRLKTDYIDVLQIHRFDKTTPPEETMRALHDLVMQGKVHYIGASSMWTYELAQLQSVAEREKLTKISSMQNHYNLLYREEEREMNKYCRLNNIALIPWAPLASGHLACTREQYGSTRRTAFEKQNTRFSYGQSVEDRDIISRVAAVAGSRGWSMTHVSLAWLNKRVTAPVIGFTSIGRIDEAILARDKVLTAEEEAYLEQPYRDKAVEGHV